MTACYDRKETCRKIRDNIIGKLVLKSFGVFHLIVYFLRGYMKIFRRCRFHKL